MPAATRKADPLHVDVPPNLVQELKAEVLEDLRASQEVADEMIWALGGKPLCFERFLVARNLNVAAAAIMVRDTLVFRSQLSPMTDELKARTAPLWPGCFIDRTKDGNPLVIFQLGKIDPRKILATVTEDEFRAFYIFWMETSLRHQRATGHKKTIEVYDLKGLSFSQLYMPGIRMLARTLKIGQGHYMESLHRCIIINTPRVFKMAWTLISSVLNERTRAKTLFFSDDGSDFLSDVMGYTKERVQALLADAAQTINQGGDKAGTAWLQKEPQRPARPEATAATGAETPWVKVPQWSRTWELAQPRTPEPGATSSSSSSSSSSRHTQSVSEYDATAVNLREVKPGRISTSPCAAVQVVYAEERGCPL